MKTNTNSVSELKNRTAQRSGKSPLWPIDMTLRHCSRRLSTERVLHLLRTRAPHFWELAEVVGKWVWVQFDGKQPKQITAALSELGFHWNNHRQVWQHPCGTVTLSSNQDPRRKYRCYFPADMNPA
jgi:hypothetical protein